MPASFAVGWRQVGICVLLLSATGMIAATYSLVAVPLAQEYAPNHSVLMLSMTVLAGTCALLSPLLGTLMDRVSLRVLMSLGGLVLLCWTVPAALLALLWLPLIRMHPREDRENISLPAPEGL